MAEEAFTYTISAPNMGLDLVSPIDQMDPLYALEAINIVCAGFSSYLRKGYSLYNAVTTTPILAMQGMNNADGTNSLFTHTTGKIFRITSGVKTDVSFAAYSTTPFQSDTFGYLAYFCNGIDTAQQCGPTGVCANLAFTGPTLTDLVNVSSFNERQYFIQKNSFIVWYPASAGIVTGALISTDFKYGMKDGGFAVACGSYTNNEAAETQDLFYIISSEGEILLYDGTSPSDSTTPWQKVSRYKVGRPVGYKCTIRVGNDTWVITNQGIVSMKLLFSTDPISALKGVGEKINPYIVQQALMFPFSSSWSGTFWPQGRRVYITVPVSGTTSKTLVYHMDGGWSYYNLNYDADGVCITTSGSSLYYGAASGNVFTGETGQNDNGSAISFTGKLAYNFYGNRGLFKAFKDVRPLMRTSRNLSLAIGLNTDFREISDLATIPLSSGTYTPWGSPWGSPWSIGVEYIYDRHSLNGQGTSAALRFRGSLLNAPLEFYGFEIGFEPGSRV